MTPSGGALAIEVSNHGGAAPSCCVIVQVGDGLYAGNFPLADRQDWAPQTLTRFDTIPGCVSGAVRIGLRLLRRARLLDSLRTEPLS